MKPFRFVTILMCLSLWLSALQVNAQNHSKPYQGTVGLHVGSQGFGISGSAPISDQFGVRAGLSFLPFDTEVNETYGEYNTDSDVKARFSNLHLALDWFPFHAANSFFRYFNLSAGGGYFFKADGDFKTTLTDDYHYGEIIVPAEDLGMLKTNISWSKSVAPYLGLGFTNIDLNRDFALGLSVGSYYLRKPSVTMTGTELLRNNDANGPIIEKNAEDYRFLPVLQLNFSYKISR